MIKEKIKEYQYKKYIEEHKENIKKAFIELSTCPDLDWLITEDLSCKLFERIKIHDNSKYSAEEFDAYRWFYYPANKLEKAVGNYLFESAWKHHYENNDHHWQCPKRQIEEFTEEIELACLENICDWLAMGYKFNDRPIHYYNQHKDEICLPKKQITFMENVMTDLEKTKRDMTKYGTI